MCLLFSRRTNAGFAFVNFTKAEAATKFRDAFNGKRWNVFESSKVAQISRARIQVTFNSFNFIALHLLGYLIPNHCFKVVELRVKMLK